MEDDPRLWGSSLSLSQPHQHPPSPSPSPQHPHPFSPLPIVYVPLPFPMYTPQQTPLSQSPPPPTLNNNNNIEPPFPPSQSPPAPALNNDIEPLFPPSQSPPAPTLNNNNIEPLFPPSQSPPTPTLNNNIEPLFPPSQSPSAPTLNNNNIEPLFPPSQSPPALNNNDIEPPFPPSQSPPAPALNNNDIEPPFPWATCKRATIHTMEHLSSHGLTTITGKVKCRKCSVERDIRYNLTEKFTSVANFIVRNKSNLNHRAPGNWEDPVLPNCESCGNQNCMKPVISNNNEEINWLFLLLGEMIGCCNLKQLKYFCKYMNVHSSGAKNRVIYSTYLGLCKQLVPNGPFDP